MSRVARTLLWSLPAVILAACAPDSETASPLAPSGTAAESRGPGGASVSGHANFTYEAAPGEFVTQTTSFHGRVLPNGEVQGKLELNDASGARLHGDVECVEVIGNEAYLGGRITQSDVPGPNPAVAFWLRLVDNGEGADAQDLWSDVAYFTRPPLRSNVCSYRDLLPLRPIEGGNIQVRP